MDAQEVKSVILSVQECMGVRGTIFSAENETKDNPNRKWNCRFGVRKHLHGGSLPYDKPNLLTVFENNRKGYRQINLDTLKSLKVCGIILFQNNKPTEQYFIYLNYSLKNKTTK